jgi:hypothetical protein
MNFADRSSPSKFHTWPAVLFENYLRLCERLASRIDVSENSLFDVDYDYYWNLHVLPLAWHQVCSTRYALGYPLMHLLLPSPYMLLHGQSTAYSFWEASESRSPAL